MFRRKRALTEQDVDGDAAATGEATPPVGPEGRESGPWDIAEIGEDGVERVDLGSLLIRPPDGFELRLQVDEATSVVQSVLLAGPDGALEVRAFAAPRGGDLWSQARQQIAAETSQRGGTATPREGRFGPELVCELRVELPDGQIGTQISRVVGINGPRWLLRGTFVGGPAQSPDDAASWDDALATVVVNRGSHAMPVGDPLPINLPAGVRRPGD